MTQSFDKITIVGLGLIGGSLVQGLRRALPDLHLTGVDQPAVLEQAATSLDAAFPPEQCETAVAAADLIFLAAPIAEIKKLLPRVASALKAGALVTDTGSTKGEILQLAKESFGAERFFVGGHPMAGREKGGWANADPFLFENAIYVLTRPAYAPEPVVEALAELLQRVGASVMYLDAAEHDRVAADVSHLPQLLAVALTNFIARSGSDGELRLRLAAGGFRDMTRIATSPYAVWRDILLSNSPNIMAALDQLLSDLQALRHRLHAGDLRTEFDTANALRQQIPRDTRGFLHPHFDVFIIAPDEPGIIARLANALAEQAVNIKDIEVLKIREGSGGTLRLAFESEPMSQAAVTTLRAAGFQCWQTK